MNPSLRVAGRRVNQRSRPASFLIPQAILVSKCGVRGQIVSPDCHGPRPYPDKHNLKSSPASVHDQMCWVWGTVRFGRRRSIYGGTRKGPTLPSQRLWFGDLRCRCSLATFPSPKATEKTSECWFGWPGDL